MNIDTTQIIGVAVLGIILPFVWKLIQHFTNKKQSDEIHEILDKTKDLYDWHSEIDPATGLKRWFNHPSQNAMLEKMQENAISMMHSQEKLVMTTNSLVRTVEKLVDKIERMEKDKK